MPSTCQDNVSMFFTFIDIYFEYVVRTNISELAALTPASPPPITYTTSFISPIIDEKPSGFSTCSYKATRVFLNESLILA